MRPTTAASRLLLSSPAPLHSPTHRYLARRIPTVTSSMDWLPRYRDCTSAKTISRHRRRHLSRSPVLLSALCCLGNIFLDTHPCHRHRYRRRRKISATALLLLTGSSNSTPWSLPSLPRLCCANLAALSGRHSPLLPPLPPLLIPALMLSGT